MSFRKIFFIASILLIITSISFAQNKMTPELLWQLGRVGAIGISKDGKYVLYNVTTFNTQDNNASGKTYMVPIAGGEATVVTNPDSLLNNDKISPDGKYIISDTSVK